MSQTEMSLTTA